MFSHHAKSLLRIDKYDDADETDKMIKKTCKSYKSEIDAIKINNN